MELKRGYKQTEVGVIPEDWEVKRLGEIGESLIGLTYKPSDVRSDGILVLRSSNIQESALCFDDNVFVEMEVPDRIMVRNGDILICVRNGSRDLIGKCILLDARTRGATFGAFMAVFRTPEYGFIYHQFRSTILKRQIHEHLGATINQITNKSLNSFCIPFPPRETEQEAIAEALSDADALIESLEQLLTKKRQIKQGAMQELLTGKKRLPGFEVKPGYKQTEVGVIPEDWEVRLLGKSCEVLTKGTTPTSVGREFTNGGISFLKAESISETGRTIPDKVAYIDESTHRMLKRSQLSGGDILVSIAGVLGRVGVVEESDLPANTNQALAIVRISDRAELVRFYVFYCLRSPIVSKQIHDISVQAAQANISLQNVGDFLLPIPPTLAEQTAIASVLSGMDSDLSALETKLTKARQLKQGMMHELLTGRIRLI